MTAKSAIAAALMPLCFVPAALLGYVTQVRLAAFEGIAARMERVQSRAIERVIPRATSQAIALAPAGPELESAPRADAALSSVATHGIPVAVSPRKKQAAPARGCKDWRPLAAGPAALAARVGPVRVCEGAPPNGSRRVASQSAPSARARSAKRPSSMSFEFDLRDPR